MSAIAGIFSRRGAPRRPGEIDEMLAVMASRGPDGTETWSGDRITLGHGALHATPEAVGEQMPLVDPLTGNVVVADVRLDNRPELLTKLGLGGRDPGKIGDGRLLLDAYRTWGEDCVDHLLGDFAFAIWDERRQQLFLARDHFGAKPLTYHFSDGLFAFASDSRSVVGLQDVPSEVNRDRVFDFLAMVTEWTSTTQTFFDHVYRLQPAHTLTVAHGSLRDRRYWHLPTPEMINLRSDAEYEEATREVLSSAVACRLRGRGDVGISLSGGIDSSSITALSLELGPVNTYSAVAAGDPIETALIRLTTAHLPITSHSVDRSSVRRVCGDFVSTQRDQESLFDNGALVRAVMSTAAEDGRRSVLTGMLADEVIAIPPVIAMRSFIADRQVLALARLAVSNGNLGTQVGRYRLARSVLTAALSLGASTSEWQTRRRDQQWAHWKRRAVEELHLRISAEELRSLDERLDATVWNLRRSDGPASLRHRLFDGEYAIAALERYDRSGAEFSIECRNPFVDRRVVEFFQRLPARQLVAGGWTKSVLRRSMVRRLPTEVVWSKQKPHLGWSFNQEWTDVDPQHFLGDLPTGHPLHAFVDVDSLLRTPAASAEDRIDRLRPFVSLGLWLEDPPV